MKNKKWNRFIIVIIILLILVGLWFVFCQQDKIEKLEQVPVDIGKMRVENILLKEGFFHSYDFEDIVVDCFSLFTNYEGDSINLAKIVSGEDKLIVFMNVGTCNCVFDNLDLLGDLKKEKIILGIDGLSNKEFKAFVSQNNIKDIAYLLPNNFYKGFEISPIIYFVLDKDLHVKYHYAPSLAFPELTDMYLKKVSTLINF